ncbi:hypothetical protein H3L96_00495 [Neisseria wadsworthii]|nr:hypothetical protein H3L96_00495 [Neisseria wadsworthii]
MKTKMKTAVLLLTTLFAGACSTLDLKYTRNYYNSESKRAKVQAMAEQRSQQISDHQTLYGKKLECLRDMHADFFDTVRQTALQSGVTTGSGYFRMAVAPFRDKTGKVFDANSTAISDMVMDAVSHFRHFDLVETPLFPDTLIESRNNFLHPNYVLPGGIVQNFSSTMTSLQHVPTGVNFPSNYYIAGALTQYDEEGVLPNNHNLGIDIYQYQYSRDVQALTVTVNMRLIDSWTGTVMRVNGTNELATVSLTNTFYAMKNTQNFFRLIGEKDYGIDYTAKVADPKMAAVKEMVDKGVYQLLDKFLKPYKTSEQSC